VVDINWTAEAESWLHDIYTYIARDSVEAARRVVEGIYEKAQALREYPELGYRYEHSSGEDVRILLYGHYRIAYLRKSTTRIDILGVFHGALDVDRYLL
jgi:toxin ParE1/3/4